MLVANYSEFRTKLKNFLDAVEDNDETLIVKRGSGKGTVVISLDEYNSMMETAYLLNNRANRLHLEESIAQMEAGQASEFAGPLCWKCHDPFKQGLDEGVTCEFCHGKTGETGCDQVDEDLHKKVRKAGLERLRDEKWCHK